MKHMLRFLAVAAIFLWVQSAQAQDTIYSLMTSTPDISVTSTATIEVFRAAGHGGPARAFDIKNDCTDTLYFSLNRSGSTVNDYRLRLGANEAYGGHIRLFTLMASADSDGSTDCTFTLILME